MFKQLITILIIFVYIFYHIVNNYFFLLSTILIYRLFHSYCKFFYKHFFLSYLQQNTHCVKKNGFHKKKSQLEQDRQRIEKEESVFFLSISEKINFHFYSRREKEKLQEILCRGRKKWKNNKLTVNIKINGAGKLLYQIYIYTDVEK